jgi:predicted small lipoprotein YifL
MKDYFTIILMIALSSALFSCGKRGDLLPPEGYEVPKE